MQTLIYCDLDGVLHRWPCGEAGMFDADCIARLEAVLRPYEVGLVITSTWRLEWPLAQLRKRMGVLGPYVVGATPEIDDPFLRHGRYHEVLQHQEVHVAPGSRWIAIDDEPGRATRAIWRTSSSRTRRWVLPRATRRSCAVCSSSEGGPCRPSSYSLPDPVPSQRTAPE